MLTVCAFPNGLSFSLHREALKQAATDPKTGIIDIGILTTGVSSQPCLTPPVYSGATTTSVSTNVCTYAALGQ